MTKGEYFEHLRKRWTHSNLKEAAVMTFLSEAADDQDADRQLRESGRGTFGWMLRAGILRPQMTVYEIGCGVGRVATELAQYLTGGRYVGVDVSPEYISLAAARCPTGEFYVTNGYEFPLPENSADLVISFAIFCHMPLQQVWRWLLETKRVLRPGGNTCLQFHNLAAEYNWANFVLTSKDWRFITDPEAFQTYPTADMVDLLFNRAELPIRTVEPVDDSRSWFVIAEKN